MRPVLQGDAIDVRNVRYQSNELNYVISNELNYVLQGDAIDVRNVLHRDGSVISAVSLEQLRFRVCNLGPRA